jgi:hypothetical protein
MAHQNHGKLTGKWSVDLRKNGTHAYLLLGERRVDQLQKQSSRDLCARSRSLSPAAQVGWRALTAFTPRCFC